ncbi:MAG: carotenoid 1,2-hydratase [Betaproteobacteria bacterium]|nr:carotenoid 1,2-hydratase [Betaproteobacteria bacterium]
MKRRDFLALGALATLRPLPAAATTGYPAAQPGTRLVFPRDHGAHPEFRTEWWYLTGQLADGAGRGYGFQVTFFRSRPRVAEDNPSRFAARQLVLAHAALADAARGQLLHDQRAARAVFDLAGTDLGTTRAWIGDWRLERAGEGYAAQVAARDFRLDLHCAVTQPVLLQGDDGYSRKGPGARQASHYYSLPQLAVSGRVGVGAAPAEVSGRAWLDHEWSSEIMAPGAVGWDWLGINLDDGGALMAFVMRDAAGAPLWAAATLRDAAGRRTAFPPADVRFTPRRQWRSPRTGARYPVAVDVGVGTRRFAVEPWFDDQELDARASTGTIYWEGAVRVSEDGRPCGSGYLELTGYAAPLAL